MTQDIFPCHTCGRLEHIDLLDSKDDGTGNYTILECVECYGPGWDMNRPSDRKLSVCPELQKYYITYLVNIQRHYFLNDKAIGVRK